MLCRARERWGEWSTEAITSLQSLLVIALPLWKRTRTAWAEATSSRQTGGEKAWCDSGAQKVSAISQGFGSGAAPLGTGSTRVSALCSVCQASSYPQVLKHWTCHSEDVGAFKNPRSKHLFTYSFYKRKKKEKKNSAGGWSVWGPVRVCERSLKDSFVGHSRVPVWLWNGRAIRSSSKPSNFLKRTDRKTKPVIRLRCPWRISFMNVLEALQVHRGLAALPRWISLFWISISPLRFALISAPEILKDWTVCSQSGGCFLKTQRPQETPVSEVQLRRILLNPVTF